MIPFNLTLHRFGTFKQEQTFTFPRGPGLYFMQGVNEAEPKLEANGTGKTTLWNALTWLLFGKTVKGLKAGDVASWDEGKGAFVQFDFGLPDDGQCVWSSRRSWSPNTWTLSHVAEYATDEEVIDLNKDTTNTLLSWLRLDFNSWLHCILMAQNQPMFLDLKSDAKAGLFSEVLGLDAWLERSKRASVLAAEQDGKTRKLERQLSELQGELDGLLQTDVDASFAEWESQRRKRLADLLKVYEPAIEKHKGLKRNHDEAVAAEESARSEYDGKGDSLSNLRDGLEQAEKRVHDLDKARALADAARDRARVAYKAGDVCPECGQTVSKETHAEHERKAKQVRDLAELTAREAYGKLQKARQELSNLTTAFDRTQRVVKEANDKLIAAENSVKELRRTLQLLDRDLDRMEDDAERIEKERNPYADMQADLQRKVARLQDQQEALTEELDEARERYSRLTAWTRGFKEIRLQQISEALDQLEIEVNNEVGALGLLDWSLKFDVDRETKKGSLQRGFSVYVQSPHNERLVPWEAWSGGEAQRLRLAATMGLSNLIRTRTGTQLDLEVWDEPTQGMSQQGITDLLNTLRTRAQQERRQIWVVDHRSLGFGGFDGICTVTKTRNGSRFTQDGVYTK